MGRRALGYSLQIRFVDVLAKSFPGYHRTYLGTSNSKPLGGVFRHMQRNGRQFDWLPVALHTRKTEMVELLADAIANLPERERLVFTLSYYEGLEASEIASMLQETALTILQLQASAVAHIKAQLADAE